MTRLRTLAGLSVVPPLGPEWGVIEFQNGGKTHRFATQMLPSITGEKAILQVLRETHMDPRRLDEIGLLHDQLAKLKSALKRRSGLIVLSGPAGSGLDTTAYASLLRIDRSARSVATIERVAQGQVPGVHRMGAADVDEKNTMLRALMRTDTDVVYVQDLSGVESATLALSAAIEHQKLVLTSLHSSSAAAAVTHFVNLGIEPWLVGSGIALIQAQRLLRRLCVECREHAVVLGTPSPDEQTGLSTPEPFASHRAVGCDACHGLGYTDERILVCESMPFSDHLQPLVIGKASAVDTTMVPSSRTRSSCATPTTGTSGSERADPIGLRPRARWSGRSATSGRASSTGAPSRRTTISTRRPFIGLRRKPMCAATER